MFREFVLAVFIFVQSTTILSDDYHPNVVDITRTRHKRTTLKHESASYWLQSGADELNEALGLRENKKLAKNIVLVIGDGMSLSTNTGGRIYKGQRDGKDGASAALTWDKFPYVGL